jgi:histidine triad (HIT) family protein
MLYRDFLQQRTGCPFCDPNEYKFIEDEYAFLSYSLAPYHKHHLLVIPKRHHLSLFDINEKEKASIDNLISKGMRILKDLGYINFTLLAREGDNNGKSVPHIHWHLVPDTDIGVMGPTHHSRSIMTPDEIAETIRDISDKI